MFERLRRRRPASTPQVPVLLPEPLATQVRALLDAGERIEAVRLTRERTGLSLLLAVRAVDATGETSGEVVVPPRDPWALQVVRRDGRLLLQLHVASGHADRDVELPVEDRHVTVLRDDRERSFFLLAALHHPFQLAETELSPAAVQDYLDTVLLADRASVERFLTDLDRGRANGALSNLVRLFTGADPAPMRAGRWFDVMPPEGGPTT